ncbi:hypothetical protein JNB88_31945 [Rhizobium cauense]|uniref:hypothetical protein n=1 Tax=Rhizobium cauense TaxID=1166683 RepID=UPI001C6F109D|nr:hypothetical protein [Rhizobium cauense]
MKGKSSDTFLICSIFHSRGLVANEPEALVPPIRRARRTLHVAKEYCIRDLARSAFGSALAWESPTLSLVGLRFLGESRQVLGKTHGYTHAFMQNAHHTKIAVIEFAGQDIVMLVAADVSLALHIGWNSKAMRKLTPDRLFLTQALQVDMQAFHVGHRLYLSHFSSAKFCPAPHPARG